MKYLKYVSGFIIGIINSLLGAGGGMLAVPTLNKSGLTAQESHATSLLIILPLTAVSAGIYLSKGYVEFSNALPYMPGGIIGAVAGGLLLNKIPNKALKIIFAAFMIYSGIRMLFF